MDCFFLPYAFKQTWNRHKTETDRHLEEENVYNSVKLFQCLNHKSKTSTHHLKMSVIPHPQTLLCHYTCWTTFIRLSNVPLLHPRLHDVKCENVLEVHTTATADLFHNHFFGSVCEKCFLHLNWKWPLSFCLTQTSPSAYLFTAGGTRLDELWGGCKMSSGWQTN